MIKNQKSVRDGIEDFLCPFTDMYISQGANGSYSHKGIMANDIRGIVSGIKYPYYAPCTCKCIRIYPESGQAMWQSINKVRFANGRIDYATFMTVHDDSFNAYIGLWLNQGDQIGNMGMKGNATGVHCHIQISQSRDTSWYQKGTWICNGKLLPIYGFNNEYDTDDCFFVDGTNIIKGNDGNWKTTNQFVTTQKSLTNNINIGDNVKFDGVFKVDILKSPLSTNLFGCTELTGISYFNYYHERCRDYHWIPLDDFTETNRFGSSKYQDDIVTGGKSYVINKNTYKVLNIDIKTDSIKLNICGRDVWLFSKYFYKII